MSELTLTATATIGTTRIEARDTEESVIMRVICEKGGNGEDDDCGVYSVYRFYRDGSFRAILNACGHYKRLPTRARILAEFAKASELAQVEKQRAQVEALAERISAMNLEE